MAFTSCAKKVRDEADETYEDKDSRYWYNHWHDFASKHLFGIEINEQISRVAKMNMIIHDDGHTNVVTMMHLKILILFKKKIII